MIRAAVCSAASARAPMRYGRGRERSAPALAFMATTLSRNCGRRQSAGRPLSPAHGAMRGGDRVDDPLDLVPAGRRTNRTWTECLSYVADCAPNSVSSEQKYLPCGDFLP